MTRAFWHACTFALLLFVTTGARAATESVIPAIGPPYMVVTITGSGFDPSTLIDIYFDTADVALSVSNASGALTTTIPIPASAQPGTHWVTISERRNAIAAQKPFLVSSNWPQTGFGPAKRSWNPYENTVTTTNVAGLAVLWSRPLDGFANSKPPIVLGNTLFVRDAYQVARAFDFNGKLLWNAHTPANMFPDSLTPAAGAGKVFFSDYSGNVIAYNYHCRVDGGACVPAWTTNVGSAIAGGLTLRGGLLYAPSADGHVHVLNPTTGAQTSNISVASDALTSWIAFAANGTGYVAHGTRMVTFGNGTFDAGYGAALSPPVVGADTAYATEADAILDEVPFGWTTALSGAGCATPPAYANGMVFAAGCTSIGAYDAGTGSLIWSTATTGTTDGLSYANGVLYGCVASRVVAYAAGWGSRLWTGGHCSAAPIIVNGVLYATYANLTAYSLNGALTGAVAHAPLPSQLKPTIPAAR